VVASARMENSPDDGNIRSPGLLHRHYAPSARVIVVGAPPPEPPPRSAYIGMAAPPLPDLFDRTRVCRSVNEYAYELFEFFRSCDMAGIQTIYCEHPMPEGLGAALADRLRRASTATA
jgi:L-threonylcarbamoyladenylate synthase